jgi:hypothetical protein
MRRIRQTWFLIILSIFWIAQVQGTVHAIGHVQDFSSKQSLTSHSILCVECAALAQAGAAPVPSIPVAVVPPPTQGVESRLVVAAVPTAVVAFYRSRAPPVSPI